MDTETNFILDTDTDLVLDTVIAEKTLVSAQQMAEQSNLPVLQGKVPNDLRGATPIAYGVDHKWSENAAELHKRGKIAFTPPAADWSPYDQLALPVWVGEAVQGRIRVTIHMGTHTSGIQDPDRIYLSYPLGARARDSWSGWRVLAFPFENFLVHGIPNGWTCVAKVEIDVAAEGDILLGDLLLQQRKRAKGPRLTVKGLLNEVDLSYPGLEAVAEAVAAEDYEVAQRELTRYYRQRNGIKHIYGQVAPEKQKNFDPTTAEQICNHYILGQQLDAEIDWRANPMGYLEWMHWFNRHRFMPDLLDAYLITKNPKYAKKMDYFVRTWIAANPAPIGNNGGGDAAWETLSVAARSYNSLLPVFFSIQAEQEFSDETFFLMLRSFWAHAQHLLVHSTTNATNWLIVESRVLAIIGMLFPEFKKADEWREAGFERLVGEVQRQVFPDGVQHEISASYHIMAGKGFADPYEIAQLNGVEVPTVYKERLEGMFDYILHLARPDNLLPCHNDSRTFAGQVADWLAKGACLFNRPDFAWVASQGTKGTAPQEASMAFRDAGVYVQRSGWDSKARYLVFDGGPFGAGHQHEDKLTFDLFAYGTPFIVDGGTCTYMRDDWTTYYRSTFAHNTVLVNGCPQDRRHRESAARHRGSVRDHNFWVTGSTCDLAISSYSSGYRGLDADVIHRRAIMFVKPDYWCVFDELVPGPTFAESGTQFQADALFHFRPMRLQIDKAENRIRTNRIGLANLEVIPFANHGLSFKIITGQHDPVQGWVAEGHVLPEDIPAPTLFLQQNGPLPLRMITVLAPFTTGNNAGLKAEVIEDNGPAGLRLQRQTGETNILLFQWGDVKQPTAPVNLADGQITYDGKAAIIRIGQDGGVSSATLVAGRTLSWAGKDLITSEEVIPISERRL